MILINTEATQSERRKPRASGDDPEVFMGQWAAGE